METPNTNAAPDKTTMPGWAVAILVLLVALLCLQSVLLVKTIKNDRAIRRFAIQKQVWDANRAAAALPQRMKSHSRAAYQPPPNRFYGQNPYDSYRASQLEDTMNQLFTNLLSNFAAPLSSMLASPAAGDFDFMPTADMEEKDNLYIVKVDLPGLDKDQINITVRDGLLTIEGVRKSESESKDDKTGFYSQERSYGSFSRSLPLPGPVDDAGIKADYANGVLTIQLPKKPGTEKNAKKVSVQ